jgi:hypothetical protein
MIISAFSKEVVREDQMNNHVICTRSGNIGTNSILSYQSGDPRSIIIIIMNIDQCLVCRTKQSPEHLVLSCKIHKEKKKAIRRKAGFKKRLTLRLLMNTERGRKALFSYLKETQIATRKWLLEKALD